MASSTSEQQSPKRPRYWVGPLVAGACFALGYGITQRIVLMRSSWNEPQPEAFRQQAFPGETLEALRRRHGADQALMGDVAALEAVEAEERKRQQAKEEAEAIAAEAERRDAAQQAALVEPVVNQPTWMVTPVAAPAVELPPLEQELQQPDETTLAPVPQPLVDEVEEASFDVPDLDLDAVEALMAEPQFMEPLTGDAQEFPPPPAAPLSP